MTSADRVRLIDEVEAIRVELVALQERFADVLREVRDLPGGEWLYEQVDAYPGIRLDRDMDAGRNAEHWLQRGRRLPRARGGRRGVARTGGPYDGPGHESGAVLYRSGQDASGQVSGALGGLVASTGECDPRLLNGVLRLWRYRR